MSRPALALPPTFDCIAEGQDAYVNELKLRPLARQYGRYWSFHHVPTTVALPDNRYAKSLKGFTSHATEPEFRALLAEYAEHNVPRPSGYADVFHEHFRSPRVPFSVNHLLAPAFAGGWQSALSPGRHRGTYYKYDMRSAYLWAATLGLPDTRTYTRSLKPATSKYDGLYRVKLIEPNPLAPFPFNVAHECIATQEEMETYNLRIAQVIDGVTWKRLQSSDPILAAIRRVSTWKQAGRSYWGRWSQMQRIECVAGARADMNISGKRWEIPNLVLNIPWAHLIVSRVKMRLWQHAGGAVHVFVDSVITPHQLRTGDDLGDWRLEKTYANGVIVKKPGQYGAADADALERMAGVPKSSPLRTVA